MNNLVKPKTAISKCDHHLKYLDLEQKVSFGVFQDLLICRRKHQVSDILTIQRIMSKLSILIINNGRLDAPSSGGRVRQKLRSTTTVHGTKVRDSFIDGTTHSQKTVVLKDDGCVIAKLLSNTFTFIFAEDNTVAPDNIRAIFEIGTNL